ncbi:MAG TPA: VWA domain-containing protein [Methylophilaceae bacterium]|nr:VWA domain-containing protein [Methylophilaceae bacterium]
MKKLLDLVRENYESLLLALLVLMLALALLKPDIQLKQEVHSYLLLADVSQSMNAEDVKIGGKPVSRMEYTKHLMKRVVETSPCGTYFSLGVFAGENVALLDMPLEVCANYDVLTDTIDHLEWRMAWRGNSRLSFGVKSAESIFDYLNAPAQLIFFTDGDEAPKVNAINKLDLSGVRIGKNLLFVGVGGHQPVPIPRYNSRNKRVGFWSTDSKDNSPGAVGVTYSDTSKDEPDPMVAYAEYDRYLSQLDSEYLQSLAQETKAAYIEGQDTPAFYERIHGLKAAGSFVTAYSMRWVYLSLALIFLILTYLPDLLRRTAKLRRLAIRH